MFLRNKNLNTVRQFIQQIGEGSGLLPSVRGDVRAVASGEKLRFISSSKAAEYDTLKNRQFYVFDGLMNAGTVYMPDGRHFIIPTTEVGDKNVSVEVMYPAFDTANLIIGSTSYATTPSYRVWQSSMAPHQIDYYSKDQSTGTYLTIPAPAAWTRALISPTGYGREVQTLRFPIRWDGKQMHVGSLFPHHNFEHQF